MLKIEKAVLPSPEQWEIIIEGMRNPKNSWGKMDSTMGFDRYHIGEADHELMMGLAKGGSVHAKYRRMIPVIFTVTAPTFWWIEFDTYKVGTVRNSCSKMHKIHVAPFTIDNFSHEGCDEVPLALEHLKSTVDVLESLRQRFNETQDKKYWRALLELLPHGYNMKATISLNYEVLTAIYRDRKNHKLEEWHTFCNWIKTLPYSELIIMEKQSEIDARFKKRERLMGFCRSHRHTYHRINTDRPICPFEGNEFCRTYFVGNAPPGIIDQWYELFFGKETDNGS